MIEVDAPRERYVSVRNPYLHLAMDIAQMRGCPAYLDRLDDVLCVHTSGGPIILTEHEARQECKGLHEVLEVENENDRLFNLKILEMSYGLHEGIRYPPEGLVEQKQEERIYLTTEDVELILDNSIRLLGESPSILPSIKSRR